jgi:hypothetical protein
MLAGSQFLQQADVRRQRFLAAAFAQSYETLDWLTSKAAATFYVHEVGEFDGVKVLEFKPRLQVSASG